MTETTVVPEVADNVRAETARAGLTQAAIAGTLGVSQQAVSAKLAGRTPFTVAELVKIAARLDIPLPSLLPAASSGVA